MRLGDFWLGLITSPLFGSSHEVEGGGYRRVYLPEGAFRSGVNLDRFEMSDKGLVVVNHEKIVFGPATDNWGLITRIIFSDSKDGPPLPVYCMLNPYPRIGALQSLEIDPGELKCTVVR